MDEELPKKPKDYVLGTDFERHSADELRELATMLEQELGRVRQALDKRQDVRAAAEALFKSAAANPES